MNGVIAQLVALTAHGNLFLSGSSDRQYRLADNSTFQFVSEVDFARPRAFLGLRGPLVVVARTPEAWYDTLRDQGVTRLFLSRTIASAHEKTDPRFGTAFIGDETPAIVANRRGARSDMWMPEWRVVRPDAPDQHIWAVRYTATEGPPPFPEIGRDHLDWAADSLASALVQVIPFAAGHGASTWVPWFERAERLLSGTESEPPYHPDLLPELGYSGQARRLLNGCVCAWVFGGMGSWNDNQPDDSANLPMYEALTRTLFNAVLNGLVAAVNAFEAPRSVAG
jgi:hypothetical protein